MLAFVVHLYPQYHFASKTGKTFESRTEEITLQVCLYVIWLNSLNTRTELLAVLEEKHAALAFCVDEYPNLVAHLDRLHALLVTGTLAITVQPPIAQVDEPGVIGVLVSIVMVEAFAHCSYEDVDQVPIITLVEVQGQITIAAVDAELKVSGPATSTAHNAATGTQAKLAIALVCDGQLGITDVALLATILERGTCKVAVLIRMLLLRVIMVA